MPIQKSTGLEVLINICERVKMPMTKETSMQHLTQPKETSSQ